MARKTAFGIAIHNKADLAHALSSGALKGYGHVVFNAKALEDVANDSASAEALNGKTILLELDIGVDAVDDDSIDWLFRRPAASESKILVTLSEVSIDRAVTSKQMSNTSSALNLAEWLNQRCTALTRQSGLGIILENRLTPKALQASYLGDHGLLKLILATNDKLDVSIELDTLLQNCFAHGSPESISAFATSLAKDIAGRCVMISMPAPLVQERSFENLSITLSNYPREMWSLLADVMRALNATTASGSDKLMLNIRRPNGEHEPAQVVVKWADILCRGLV